MTLWKVSLTLQRQKVLSVGVLVQLESSPHLQTKFRGRQVEPGALHKSVPDDKQLSRAISCAT